MRRPRPQPMARTLAALVALLAATAPPPAMAAEWAAQARAAQEVGATDNVELDAGQKADLVSSTSAGLELAGRSPVLELSLATAVELVRHLEHGQLDSDNELLSTRILRLGQRSQLALDASVRRDDAASDLASRSSPGQRLDQRRLTLGLAPSWSYMLGRRDELAFRPAWSRRLFPGDGEGADGAYLDYDLWSLDLGWRHDLTRQLAAGTALYGSYFESARQRATTLAPLLTLRWRQAEHRSVELRAGPSLHAVETQARSTSGRLEKERDQGLGFTVRAALTQALGASTTLELAAERANEPSGDNGEIVEASRLSLRLLQGLGPNWRLELAGLLQRQSGVAGAARLDDRTYVEIEPGIAWALTREAALSLRYRYRREAFDDGGSADAHAITLRLGYELPVLGRGR